MPPSFWAAYAVKLAFVALVLGGLYLLARRLRFARFFAGTERRLALLESRALTPHASLHLVRVGRRHLLIGVGSTGPRALAELDAGDVEGDKNMSS